MILQQLFGKRNLVLLRELVITDFKLRYQGSVLGYAWSLLKPIFIFAIMYVVFGLLVKLGTIQHYAVYLLVGIVIWTFFSEITNQGMDSITGRGELLRKISFPKYIIVLATSISALINLALNLCIVVILMIINGVEINWNAWTSLLFIVEIYFFALGLAFFLSALNVKFRDTSHIWEVVMQAAIYATPIIYPLDIVVKFNELAAKLLLLNPVAQAIQDIRHVLVTNQTITMASLFGSVWYYLIPLVIVAATFFGGVMYFHKQAAYFAERI